MITLQESMLKRDCMLGLLSVELIGTDVIN